MASEKMYDLAFQFRASKLWQTIQENEIFALRLSGGEIGYCCVMGATGQTVGLSLYIGESGYQSLRRMLNGPAQPFHMNSVDYREWLLGQDCLQCTLENKDALSEDEVNEVRKYAREHKISLRGRNSFPHFKLCMPNHLPWFFRSQKQQREICQALSSALALSARLETQGKRELGLVPLETAQRLPLLSQDGQDFRLEWIDVPAHWEERNPRPVFPNEIMTARLRRIPRGAPLLCEYMRLFQPFQDTEDQPPFFPAVLLCADAHSGNAYPLLAEQPDDAQGEAYQLLTHLGELLIHERGSRPREIRVRSQRSYDLLEDFCAKSRIPLQLCESLPALDEVQKDLLKRLREDELLDGELYDGEDEEDGEELFQNDESRAIHDLLQDEGLRHIVSDLSSMNDLELSMLPREFLTRLAPLIGIGLFPHDFEKRLLKLLKS